ncbi:substrate-binding periplasmic protein [Maridesulfovibrio zosterae]|uniref:substrate-binding periplasmic protein n=1 Tax=Maridesulfovibrio zosterae TaxID=82171 RepID=UPI0004804F1D|nr:transporter substrate-binding domain-containing protein [Maridesulfovibrio zosterae]
MLLYKIFGLLALNLTFLFTLCAQAYSSDEIINIASVEYPPIVSMQEIPGLGYGMCRDVVTEAFKAVSEDVNFTILPMSRNVWSVVHNKGTICLGSMVWFKRENKDALVDFVEIINLNFVAYYKKKRFPDGVSYESLKDLRGYSFGNVRGSGSQPTLENANLKIDLVRNIRLNFQKLSVDRMDFAVSLRVTGNYLIPKLFPDNVSEFAYLDKPLLRVALSVIFLRKQKRIKQKFIKGLSIIAKNGTYLRILDKYYGTAGVPEGTIPDFIKSEMENS